MYTLGTVECERAIDAYYDSMDEEDVCMDDDCTLSEYPECDDPDYYDFWEDC